MSLVLNSLFGGHGILAQVFGICFLAFWLWMLMDAIRREEWLWVVFMFLFPPINTPLYYFLVYRRSGEPAFRGFELPGTHERSRIKNIESQIAHLDKAHHHLELGDIYFQQGRLEKAIQCYHRAHERDPSDPDTRAHLGQCLQRLNRAAEALPLLEGVCAENPRHDYGHTMMALAEAQGALGQTDAAINTWGRVLAENSYARARVQLAELLAGKGEHEQAKSELRLLLADDEHAAGFQRKRDAAWVKRARKLLGRL